MYLFSSPSFCKRHSPSASGATYTIAFGKSDAQLEQPNQCWRLGAIMADTLEPSFETSATRPLVASVGLWRTSEPSSNLMIVVVVSISKLYPEFSLT